jgi:predicted ATPase
MSDSIDKLTRMFSKENRYANFGPVVNKVKINGFRGITNFELNFNFPITAISGINGSGKSSICQIVACAFKKPQETVNYNRYYLKDFFPVSVLDPIPFIVGSNVEYSYQTDVVDFDKQLTITRRESEWSGYKRQPERNCYYIGFTIYIPKVERRDLSIYFGTKLDRKTIREISNDTKSYISKILDRNYDSIKFEELSYNSNDRKQKLEIGIISRNGIEYSENHMGFGEARILYIVDLLENSPNNSLFVIEEPETSLHEDAQYKLAKYLMEVCIRKKHQIIISTHSSAIINALPRIACVCLFRKDNNDLEKIEGVSSQRIKSILSKGREKALTIICEDKIAKQMIEEIIRVYDNSLLRSVGVHDVGNIDTIKKTISVIKEIPGYNLLGVLDTETQVGNHESLVSMPGTLRPEQEILNPPEVIRALSKELGVNVHDILIINSDKNHHQLLGLVAHEANVSLERVEMFAITEYVIAKGQDYFNGLILKIKDKIGT